MADKRLARMLAGLSLQQLSEMQTAEYLHAPKGGTRSCRRRHEHKVTAIAKEIRSRGGNAPPREQVQIEPLGRVKRKSHSRRAPKRGLIERKHRAPQPVYGGRPHPFFNW